MSGDFEAVNDMRAKMETKIISTEGVVMVGVGIGRDGKHCLKIGTSAPPDDVRGRLPQEIFQVPVEIDYVGEIEAQ